MSFAKLISNCSADASVGKEWGTARQWFQWIKQVLCGQARFLYALAFFQNSASE
jgi:hypothetical protein